MSDQTAFPFFSTNLLKSIDSCPKGSPEWVDAINQVSNDIKGFEACLKTISDLPDEVSTEHGSYNFSGKESRIRVLFNDSFKPLIELPVESRLKYYKDLSLIHI